MNIYIMYYTGLPHMYQMMMTIIHPTRTQQYFMRQLTSLSYWLLHLQKGLHTGNLCSPIVSLTYNVRKQKFVSIICNTQKKLDHVKIKSLRFSSCNKVNINHQDIAKFKCIGGALLGDLYFASQDIGFFHSSYDYLSKQHNCQK